MSRTRSAAYGKTSAEGERSNSNWNLLPTNTLNLGHERGIKKIYHLFETRLDIWFPNSKGLQLVPLSFLKLLIPRFRRSQLFVLYSRTLGHLNEIGATQVVTAILE